MPSNIDDLLPATEEFVNVEDAAQQGLDYVRRIGIPYLEEEISHIKISPVESTTKTPIGEVSFGLSKIRISNVSIPKSNLTMAVTGLHMIAHDAKMELVSHWKYMQMAWPHIKDSGDVDVIMTGIQVEITLTLDTSNEQAPLLITTKCLLTIGKLRLTFEGGASWLYNLFANAIAEDMKGEIEKQVCTLVTSKITHEGDKVMGAFPEVVKTIGHHLKMFRAEDPLPEHKV